MSGFPLIFVQNNFHLVFPISSFILEDHLILRDSQEHDVTLIKSFSRVRLIGLLLKSTKGRAKIIECAVLCIINGDSNRHVIFHVGNLEADRTTCFGY